MNYSHVSIILSTYNESKEIEFTVSEIIRIIPGAEIIVVDDNSPDGTYEVLKKISYPNLKIFCRKKTRGLASAFLLGLIESKESIVGWIDSNLGILAEKLPSMINLLSQYDIVVMSRYVAGGEDKRSSLRIFTSYAINFISKLFLSSSIKDYTSGMFVMKRSVLETVVPVAYGHGEFFIEFIYRAYKKGNKIIEIPISQPADKENISKTASSILRFCSTGFSYFFRILNSLFRKD
jgi:dolichol-phosphate mannosyltransferase